MTDNFRCSFCLKEATPPAALMSDDQTARICTDCIKKYALVMRVFNHINATTLLIECWTNDDRREVGVPYRRMASEAVEVLSAMVADARQERANDDWSKLLNLETASSPSVPERAAAFMRIYARIIRANELWDIPETMARTYESAATALDQYAVSQNVRHAQLLRLVKRIRAIRDTTPTIFVSEPAEIKWQLSRFIDELETLASSNLAKLNVDPP